MRTVRSGLGRRRASPRSLAARWPGAATPAASTAISPTTGRRVAAPTGFTPAAGVCHLANFADVGTRGDVRGRSTAPPSTAPRPSTSATYPAPAADAAEPPADGLRRAPGRVPGLRHQDHRLRGRAVAYRPALDRGHPAVTEAALGGGARWYRCEVIEISSIEDDGGLVQRAGQPAGRAEVGGLPAAADLLRDPGWTTAGAIDTMPAASCTARHNAEFVGVWDAGPGRTRREDAQWAQFHDGCRELIAELRRACPTTPTCSTAPAWCRCPAARTCGRWATGACAATCGWTRPS